MSAATFERCTLQRRTLQRRTFARSKFYSPAIVPHPINSQVVKKQQSRLTLQKATKVVEGKDVHFV
jgi:hypothetical protein